MPSILQCFMPEKSEILRCFMPEKSEGLSDRTVLLQSQYGSDGVSVRKETARTIGCDNCGFSTRFPLLEIPTNTLPSSSLVGKTEKTLHLPTRFIFILAADMEETHRLNEQILKLSNQLAHLKMPHIALSSSCNQPIVHLHSSTNSHQHFLNGDHTQTDFVETCFKEAAIVLMMVSPGYLRYADEFTAGARVAESNQQRLIRAFHEQLKSEFFDLNTTQLRVWPVLHLKATRMHLPSFLSEGTYYFYPRERGSEDLFVLLKQLVFKKENQNMKS